MSVIVKGGVSGTNADVDANTNLKVNLPTALGQTGYAVLAGESWDGSSGAAVIRRTARVSTDNRLRVGIDNIVWSDTYNYTLLDAGAYQAVTATATLVMTGGQLSFNDGASIAASAVSRVQTYKTFPLLGSSALDVGFRVKWSINAQANNISELGLGFAATTATPTDGVYFRLNTSGNLEGVANFNGTEFAVALGVSPVANTMYQLRMVVDQTRLEFYIGDICKGKIDLTDVGSTVAAMTFARNLPLLMRHRNNASGTSAAQKMQVAEVVVASHDLALNKDWPTTMSLMCQNSINVARGVAAGSTANYANSAAPTSATLSNTAAGYTTLGGQWQFAAVAGAETDYALFGFQVPVTATNSANRNLVIKGIRIESFNTVVPVGTGPTVMQWGLGVGSTAVSLATADSLTAGTRAPRRYALGVQSFALAAAVGAAAPPIDIRLDSPLLVEAGTFVHIILKMPIATATATEIFRGTCMINGYFE